MEGFRENIDALADTSTLENILIAIIYWLVVLVVILFVFYISVKINNHIRARRSGKKIERDDFL